MSTSARNPFSIELSSGDYLDLSLPAAEEISLDVIATSLSKLCRYVGHCDGFYSVAEHAVLVAVRLEAEGADVHTQLLGLHHDDGEAFTGDQSRPYKRLISKLAGVELMKQVENAILDQVLVALDLDDGDAAQHTAVKAMDDWACAFEAYHLLPSKGEGWAPCDPEALLAGEVGISRLWRWDHVEAKRQFLEHDGYLRRRLAAQEAAA